MGEQVQLTPKQKKGCLVGCLAPFILIIIMIIIAASMDVSNHNQKEDAAEKALDTSLPIENRLEHATVGALGEENNMGDERNITIENIEGTYIITFLADDGSVASLESDIIDVMEGIKPLDGLDAIIIRAQRNFLDKYGNPVVDNALNVAVSKSEIDNINYENFYNSQLKNITNGYNLHPALTK